MNDNNNISDSFYFWALIYKNKLFIILFTLIVTMASVVIAYKLPVWYKSTINVVPPKSPVDSDSPVSGISSALKDFGVTKLGSKGSDTYSFTVILNSRTVVDSIIMIYNLNKVYNLPQTSMTKIREQFINNSEISIEKDGNFTISIWDTDRNRAAKIANDYVKIANNHASKVFKTEALVNVEYLDNRIATLDTQIDLVSAKISKFSNQKFLIAPEEQAKAVSKAIVDLKSTEIQYEMMLNINKMRYGDNDSQTNTYKNLLSEIRTKINDIENKPGFAGNFSLNQTADVSLEYMKLMSQYEVFTKLKSILLPSLEKSKLDLVRNAQNVFIVDEAMAADQKDKPKRSLIILGAFISSFIFSIFLLIMFSNFSEFRKKYKIYSKSNLFVENKKIESNENNKLTS